MSNFPKNGEIAKWMAGRVLGEVGPKGEICAARTVGDICGLLPFSVPNTFVVRPPQ